MPLAVNPWSRRDLLRSGGAAIAGSALSQMLSACAHGAATGTGSSEPKKVSDTPSAEPSSPVPGALPLEQRVRFAIVGLGKLALGEILPAFASCRYARPTALVSGDRAKAERTASQYGLDSKRIYDYASYDRLRDDPEVDVIYIVLPNSMHAEYTIRGFNAGKHVLCEKPMANSVEECRQMIAASEKAKKKLMIAYRMQYEPFNREAIRMARGGELGKLKNFVASNCQMEKDPKEWRLKRALSGGGPLPDVGIYCLNAARYLSGEEPVEVSATKYSTPGDPRFQEVEEQLDFMLRFPSGLLAICASSYSTYGSKSFRLIGEKAWIDLDPAFPYRGQKMRIGKAADDGSEQLLEPQIQAQNQFALEMDHMAQCVKTDRKPHTPGEEGMQDMRIIGALYESAQSGTAVKLTAADKPDAFRGPPPE